MSKFIGGVAATIGLYAAGKALSAYAEKKPELKAVKDKLARAKDDIAADCKEVAGAIAAAVKNRGNAYAVNMPKN